MDAKEEDVINLKVLVDKKQNRVVFAEAEKDFVDILLSFLTLPMGTIVRLVRKHSELGCMNSLYAGLENLDTPLFYSLKHKEMLLQPVNSSGHLCRKLKFNLDDAERARYNYGYGERYLIRDNIATDEIDNHGGIFVKGKVKFMITDDLKVMPMSVSTSFELLIKLGVKDVNALEEKILKLGLAEIFSLLRLSLLSKTPLTDLYLVKDVEPSHASMIGSAESKCVKHLDSSSSSKKMTLKIMLNKSTGKVMYAEAKEDFVDFLLSILSIPLGCVVKLLDSAPLGCISNLYKSVEELSVDGDLKWEYEKTKLLSPKVPPQFGYKMELLGMNEFFLPQGECVYEAVDSSDHIHYTASQTELLTHSKPIAVNGFVDGPASFIVTDDLTVTPLSSIANILFLIKHNLSITDLDEQVQLVSFGGEEALRLLEASLTSTSALTSAFNLNLKKTKIEK